jgi:hypothetical protein
MQVEIFNKTQKKVTNRAFFEDKNEADRWVQEHSYRGTFGKPEDYEIKFSAVDHDVQIGKNIQTKKKKLKIKLFPILYPIILIVAYHLVIKWLG